MLLLDVIEHLSSPEAFVQELRDALKLSPGTTILASTANIGFVINRLMLLAGQFNYGKRGILDLTHCRLFTFSSFRRLFEQGGFRVREMRGIPGPFALAFGDSRVSRALLAINTALVKLSRGLFSYQMFFVVEQLPSLEYLLRSAAGALDGTDRSPYRPTLEQVSLRCSTQALKHEAPKHEAPKHDQEPNLSQSPSSDRNV